MRKIARYYNKRKTKTNEGDAINIETTGHADRKLQMLRVVSHCMINC
jgi:hypothetical protein